MLGYAVESVDFNLPVDSFTRKPLFAFSCNRAIRESYDGPLFENEDGDDVGISELASNVGKKIVKIYDQKVRHGHSLHNATVNGDVYLQSETGPYYYLSFSGSSYFDLPIAQYLLGDVGVYAVCDPTGTGRAPVFSAINSTHELSFDLGSAYMRFSYYPDSEKQLLFGGIDSPDSRKDGYVGNYADDIILQSVKGSTGESRRRYDITSLSTAYIGRDKEYYYEGKIYELVITDFEIPRDSINQVFSDWGDYYALT